MFLGLRKLGNICCGHEMFLNKIRKIFVSRTQNLCPQQMPHARTEGEAFVSVTMCPQQCVLICQRFKKTTTAMATGMSLNKRFIMNRTMDAHVRYNSSYISLPSSAKQQLELLSVAHYVWKTWATTAKGWFTLWHKHKHKPTDAEAVRCR